MEETYNPQLLIEIYERLEHGKARLGGIREAIRQADENNDTTYQIYFRSELCKESTIYCDNLDAFITFPEELALVDKYPDTPTAEESMFISNTNEVLWVYKWILEKCPYFYQISKEDIKYFFKDYKHRCLASGYHLRSYYLYLYRYYNSMNDPLMEKYFHRFESTPRDRHSDCEACEQNDIVNFYLEHDNLEKATLLAADLESQKIACDGICSWLRLKINYLRYYLRKKDYQKAEEYIKLIDRHSNSAQKIEFDISRYKLHCYSYLDIAKALKVYKSKWKKWLEHREPDSVYLFGTACCIFFQKLMESRNRQTIKITYDSTFPLYRENNTYQISELYDFYYQHTIDIAKKFDTRNENDAYMKKFQKALDEI